MTISTTENSVIVACTGQNSFVFPFVGVAASDITVSSIVSNSGTVAPLPSSQYTLSLNAANPNQLWGVGGTVSFSSAPSTGTSLLIQRNLPLTQSTSVQNQGNYYAQVTEQAIDTCVMQIQQVSARTTQFRGTWTSNTAYNFGDIVQDGGNGAGTNNYYICQNSNTSSVWSTDLAAGDWAISVLATVPTTNLPITLSGAISGSGSMSIVTGINPGQVTTTSLASGAVSLAKLANIGPNSVLVNSSATSGTPQALALTSGTLVGVNGGNVAAITLGAGLSLAANTLNTNTANTYQALPANPSATTNVTGVMMGLAGSITPVNSGAVMIAVSGEGFNNTGAVGLSTQIRYGTGVAPTNGAALSGSTAGSKITFIAAAANNGLSFAQSAIVTGLGIGSAYWIDLSLATANSSDSAQVVSISLSVFEIK